MSKDDTKELIKQYLAKFGAQEVQFEEPDDNTIKVLFNASELVSFKDPVPGWVNTGIQLDDSGLRQYKIEFKKI